MFVNAVKVGAMRKMLHRNMFIFYTIYVIKMI
jgi:hypothetical protein